MERCGKEQVVAACSVSIVDDAKEGLVPRRELPRTLERSNRNRTAILTEAIEQVKETLTQYPWLIGPQAFDVDLGLQDPRHVVAYRIDEKGVHKENGSMTGADYVIRLLVTRRKTFAPQFLFATGNTVRKVYNEIMAGLSYVFSQPEIAEELARMGLGQRRLPFSTAVEPQQSNVLPHLSARKLLPPGEPL